MGKLIFTAATQKDLPLLEASVLIVGIVFLIAMLVADLLYSLLNPRIRYARRRMTIIDDPGAPIAIPDPRRGEDRARERLRLLLRSPTFVVGVVIVGVWVLCAALRDAHRSARPPGGRHPQQAPAAVGRPPLRHRPPRPRRALPRDRRRADDPHHGPARNVARHRARHGASASSPATTAGSWTRLTMRVVDAMLAVPVIILALLAIVSLGPSRVTLILVIGIVFSMIIAKTVRAAVLSERELDYVQAARLRNERASLHHVRRDPPQRDGAGHRRVHRPARLRHLHDRHARVPRLRRRSVGARLGPGHLRATTSSSTAASGGRSSSPPWPSPP